MQLAEPVDRMFDHGCLPLLSGRHVGTILQLGDC